VTLLSIDPGNRESAYVIIDDDTYTPGKFGKDDNHDLLDMLVEPAFGLYYDAAVIEQVGHYGTGMPAGKDVFDTCVWIGRFYQTIINLTDVDLVKRATVKTHVCGNPRAKDGNVIQALVDRFAPGEPNKGKGIKAEPGWFYGFAADVWQAYALAVYALDQEVRQ
jgi:hypothetical protein